MEVQAVKLHVRLIDVGSVEGLAGVGVPMATFEGFGGTPGFSVPVTHEQARQLGPLIYTWINITLESTTPARPGGEG